MKPYIPAELVCSWLTSTTQQLGAELSLLVAPNLPAKAAVHSAHEDCTTFRDLYPAGNDLKLLAWCCAAVPDCDV